MAMNAVLATVYDVDGIGFPKPIEFELESVRLCFLPEYKLPTVGTQSIGRNETGETNIQQKYVEQTFIGRPLLLVAIASTTFESRRTQFRAKQRLIDETHRAVSKLSLVFPKLIGRKIESAMYTGENSGDLSYSDVSPIYVGSFHNDRLAFNDQFVSRSNHINQANPQLSMAISWWQKGEVAESSLDQFISYYICLEILASKISTRKKIGSRLTQLFEHVFSIYKKKSFNYPLRIKTLIYDTRQNVFHEGNTLPSDEFSSVVELSREVSKACLDHLIFGKTDSQLTQECEKFVRPRS